MLTPKQKAFADYYIECGSAAEAVKCLAEIWEQTKGWENGSC